MQKTFKTYPILISILVTTQLICLIYARRQVDIYGLPVNVSGIIFPIDIYLFEIMGECFGYEYARQAVWIDSLSHLIFIVFILLIATLPYSQFMHEDISFSYSHLINVTWISSVGSLIGTFCGDLFSARFIPQTKLFLKGGYVLPRFLISHMGSETITISIGYMIIFLSTGYNISQISVLIGSTLLFKFIAAILLLPIARFIVKLIKKIEKTDAFDYKQDYKILALLIDDRKINFRGIHNVKNE